MLRVRVTVVVGKVSVADETDVSAASERKTSAKDGAGTLTWQVLAWALQFTV